LDLHSGAAPFTRYAALYSFFPGRAATPPRPASAIIRSKTAQATLCRRGFPPPRDAATGFPGPSHSLLRGRHCGAINGEEALKGSGADSGRARGRRFVRSDGPRGSDLTSSHCSLDQSKGSASHEICCGSQTERREGAIGVVCSVGHAELDLFDRRALHNRLPHGVEVGGRTLLSIPRRSPAQSPHFVPERAESDVRPRVAPSLLDCRERMRAEVSLMSLWDASNFELISVVMTNHILDAGDHLDALSIARPPTSAVRRSHSRLAKGVRVDPPPTGIGSHYAR